MDENQEFRDRTIAYGLLRIFLGVNIALHGISRFLDNSKFQGMIETQFAHSPLPHPTVIAFAHLLPWAESAVGVLVVSRFSFCEGTITGLPTHLFAAHFA